MMMTMMMMKGTLKNGFFSKRSKIKQNTAKIGADFKMNFDSRLGQTFFKVRKLVSRSARSQNWLRPFRTYRTTVQDLNELSLHILYQKQARFPPLPHVKLLLQNSHLSTAAAFVRPQDGCCRESSTVLRTCRAWRLCIEVPITSFITSKRWLCLSYSRVWKPLCT